MSKKKRKDNIVMVNIPESIKDEAKDRVEENIKVVTELLKKIAPETDTD